MQLEIKAKKYQFGLRKDYHDNKFNAYADADHSISREKYRNSVAIDSRFNIKKILTPRNEYRFSMNISSANKVPKVEETKKAFKTMQSIRSTLSQLQSRIDNAKQQLKGNNILSKDIIQQADNEESRTFELISFNESNRSRQTEEDKKKNLYLKPSFALKKVELVDLKKIKSYYKVEIAKILIQNNEKALQHLTLLWKTIIHFKHLQEPNPQKIHKANFPLDQKNINKKTLVLGLDQTLIHCESIRKSQQDIDIHLMNEYGQSKVELLSIRPHAISFLKKICKKFEVIIFSTRNKKETDLILDELDPMNQFISYRLYRDNCQEIRPHVFVKDIRKINRSLSSIIMVDSSPYGYLCQIDNGVPILPYTGGLDSELYLLQKYLQDLSKVKDVRNVNSSYFQLKKYINFDDPVEAVKCLYFSKP